MVKNNLGLRKGIFLIFFLLGGGLSIAQNSLATDPLSLSAFEYFQQKQFHSVIQLLEKKEVRSSNDEIFFQISRLKSGQNALQEIDEWIVGNGSHPLLSLAYYAYGEFAFYQKEVIKSSNYLSKVKPRELSKMDRATYGFIFGILNLQAEKYTSAASLFALAQKSGFEKEKELTYYQSFTWYHLNRTADALSGFQSVKEHPEYGTSARYFIAKILLENSQFDEVIALSTAELSDERSQTNSGFHQLIGEAYANKNNVAKADAYFEQAIKIHPDRPTAALFYQAGIAKFKIGNENKALEYLTQAGIGAGEYAQLSAFQLGRLHIKRNEPEMALVAYIEAAASEDLAIKEESLYQVASLNAQLKRFTEAINYADDYVESFQDGRWKQQIQNLIAESYLRTSNYDLAIEHLEEIGLADESLQVIYQKVTFQKAISLFNDGHFEEALSWFRKSLNHPKDVSLANDSYFFTGEILSRSNQYEKALAAYKQQSKLSSEAQYGMGYAQYNLGNYTKAIAHFEKVKNLGSREIELDAKLRLADCLYATKSYQRAFEKYESIPENSYVIFQKGLVLSNLNRTEEALSAFRRVPETSALADDAYYFTAQIRFESARFEESEEGYTLLINRFSNSEYLVRAYLNRAISRSNLNKLAFAADDYQFVIENHITSDEAFSAILGLQELEQKGVKVNNLDKMISQYKKANPDGNSLELVEFESAKGKYFSLAYTESALLLDSFLKEYPNSKFKLEATYYLGDAYFRSQELSKSKEVFERLKPNVNSYTGRVLSRLGDINNQLGFYDEAIAAYQLLLELNLSPKDSHTARAGQMNVFFNSAQYEQVIEMANRIVAAEWKPLRADQNAKIMTARSWLLLRELDKAQGFYSQLSTSDDAIAAEATYQTGWILFTKGNYQASLDILFSLNEKFGTYSEWIDQSYLLIAENYIALNELFQAKATLRSIIEHSQNDAIRLKANEKLLSIEGAGTQDSIKNEDN